MAHPHKDNVLPFDKPTASIVHITPEIAERWLGRNTSNRNIRRRRVAQYARDMAGGKWKITGEAIKFNHAGDLLDGQHRLLAVISSGATVAMFVVRGLDDDTQSIMDSGAARTASDNLGLGGHKNSTLLSACVRIILRQQNGGAGWIYEPTNSEIYAFVAENPDVELAVEIAARYQRWLDMRPSVIASATYMIGSVAGYGKAEDFWAAAAHKIGLSAGDPVIALTKTFSDYARQRKIIEVPAQISAIIRMYNARRAGKPMKLVKFFSPSGEHVAIPSVIA